MISVSLHHKSFFFSLVECCLGQSKPLWYRTIIVQLREVSLADPLLLSSSFTPASRKLTHHNSSTFFKAGITTWVLIILFLGFSIGFLCITGSVSYLLVCLFRDKIYFPPVMFLHSFLSRLHIPLPKVLIPGKYIAAVYVRYYDSYRVVVIS